MDTENPDWPDQILLDYNFETTQQVTVMLMSDEL